MKKNKKGFLLLGMSFAMLFFVFLVFLFSKTQEKQAFELGSSIDNVVSLNVNSIRQDIKEKEAENKEITNYKLNKFGREKDDEGNVSDYNILDKVSHSDNFDVSQFIDRYMTTKRKDLTFVGGKKTPTKEDNTFLIDLTKFKKNDGTIIGNIPYLNIKYGTSTNNTPDLYIVLVRVKRDQNITLTNTFEDNIVNKKFGNTNPSFGNSNSTEDVFSFDYKKITGLTSGSCNIDDKDLHIKWCKSFNVNDFLSNNSFDLTKNFYKMYIIFGNTINENNKTPFKVSSPNGFFGVGNFKFSDVTLLTADNTKKRFIIESSSKKGEGGVLPYLIYSLWVSGDVQTAGE